MITETKYTPTKSRKPEKILCEVADFIEEHGWTKTRLERRNGAVCLLGGLNAVIRGDTNPKDSFYREKLYLETRQLLMERIERHDPSAWLIDIYNDRPERKKKEVLEILREGGC